MPKTEDIVLCDCTLEEIAPFIAGVEDTFGHKIMVYTSQKGPKRSSRSLYGKLRYYGGFFLFPCKFFLHRKRYDFVIGWQQFYAIIFAFLCRLFHVKKRNRVVAVNFTYKQKPGLIGKVYYKFMRYSADSEYLDFFHVPSNAYAERMHRELGIPMSKIIVTTFGTPDRHDEWSKLPHPADGKYCFSIGRSNRDFDYLAEVFAQPELANARLVVLADLWKPAKPLPGNIEHHTDIVGDASFPYFVHADLSIVPIGDPVICSGDTVLLNSMMMCRPVAITAPSTLAEMYVTDGLDGLYLTKDVSKDAKQIAALLQDTSRMNELGQKARKTYLDHFSRYAMGRNVATKIQQP